MEKVRVAILGCGSRGNAHGAAWKQLLDVDVVALCDIDPERLHAAGERLGVARRYADLEEMFACEDLDVVSVPARADWHFPLARAVLEHGVSAVVEKPITLDLREADQLVDRAGAQGCLLAVHHQNSVGPVQQKAKALLAAGAIGELRCLRGECKGYYGGFGMMETGTHILDQMRNFGGEVEWVQARVTVRGRDIGAQDVAQAPRGLGLVAGDHVTAYYAFRNGVYGTIESFYRPKLESRFSGVDLIGTEGMLCWRTGGNGLYLVKEPIGNLMGGASWEAVSLSEEDRRVPGTDLISDDSGVWMAQEMVNALRQKREHACNGAAARTVLEMILGCYTSHASGGRAQLPLLDRTHPLQRLCEAAGVPVPEFRVSTDAEFLAAEWARSGR